MKKLSKILAILLALAMICPVLPTGVFAATTDNSNTLDYGIVHVDNGRKYFSVDSLKTIIDNAAKSGKFNYVQLAIGNDGLRFLLDDMTLTVSGTVYTSEAVKNAIHAGNEKYHDFAVDELTETEMDTIIAYAKEKGIGIIPLINTPGHMDAILYAGEALTDQTLSYSGSDRTINVTNTTAVTFTKALLQKYIDYFAAKGCSDFNMGADEYANDAFPNGGMGFAQIWGTGEYAQYITYVNDIAAMIKNAGMIPHAFNDGIYFNSNTKYGTFDSDIVVQHWSAGWSGYNVASPSYLATMGHRLINANGDWYYVLGKNDNFETQGHDYAKTFTITNFNGDDYSAPVGAAFLIWCDFPAAETDEYIASNTADLIANFGANNPFTVKAAVWKDSSVTDPTPDVPDAENTKTEGNVTVSGSGITGLTVTQVSNPEFNVPGYALLAAYDINPTGITSGTVTISGLTPPGKVLTVFDNSYEVVGTYTVAADGTLTFNASHFSVYYLGQAVTAVEGDRIDVELVVGENKIYTDNSGAYNAVTGDYNDSVVRVELHTTAGGAGGVLGDTPVSSITSGQLYAIHPLPRNSTGTGTSGGTNQYYLTNIQANKSTTQLGLSADFTAWTLTSAGNNSYYVKDPDGKYLTIGNSTTDVVENAVALTVTYSSYYECWVISLNNYYLNQWGGGDAEIAGGWTSGLSDEGSRWLLYPVEAVHDSTDITFTGLFPGETDVTVGNTTYHVTVSPKVAQVEVGLNPSSNITYQMYQAQDGETVTYTYNEADLGSYITIDANGLVTAGENTTAPITVTAAVTKNGTTIATYTYSITVNDAAPDDAETDTSLRIDYYITNSPVTANGSTYLTLHKDDAAAAQNATSIIPSAGTFGEGNSAVVYWKLVILPEDHKQTGDEGDDETRYGVRATAIRYYNGAWQYQNRSGAWAYIKNTDQVVAFYLQNIELTDEVNTLFKDWGFRYNNMESWFMNVQHVALSVAVVYPDSTMSPSEDLIYQNGTMLYGYGPNKNIGIVVPQHNDLYDITRLTIVKGANGEGNVRYNQNSTIDWEKTEVAQGQYRFVEETLWDASTDDSEPLVDGAERNIIWESAGDAYLILIYVEPKQTTLTVKYHDMTNNTAIFEYGISPYRAEGEAEPTFFSALNGVPNYADGNVYTNGYFDLGSGAYVKNASEVNQYISIDLVALATTYPGAIAAVYTTGLYEYNAAQIDRNGTTLTVYFALKEGVITDPTYVIDFGLPFEFPLSDVVEFDGDLSAYVLTVEIMSNGDFGTLTYENQKFKYIPSSILTRLEIVSVRIVTTSGTSWVQFGFLPATTMYYEEGFVNVGSGWEVTGPGRWNDATSKNYAEYMQTVTKYTADNNNTPNDITDDKLILAPGRTELNYGYDPIYNNDTGASLNSYITGNAPDKATGALADSFQFTFSGTGFDIVATGKAQKGMLAIKVLDSNGQTEKMLSVNVKLDGSYASGMTAAYGTPVVSLTGLDHDTYTVTVMIAVGQFELDGIRIYNTVNTSFDQNGARINHKAYTAYKSVLEEDPNFYEIRDLVIGGIGLPEGVNANDLAGQIYNQISGGEVSFDGGAYVFGDGTHDINELLNNGPKNELYLKPNQSVTFKLTTSRQAQIGMRGVNGATAYKINENSEVAVSTVSMFYDLQAKNTPSGTVYTITNTGSNILAITHIKISDSVEGEIFGALTEEDILCALVDMGIPEKPDPFKPAISMKWVSGTIRTGYVGILNITTSADVETLTVNGEELKGYKIRNQKIWTYYVSNDTPGVYTYDVVAVNAEGVESEVIKTPALTVNRSIIYSIIKLFF